ncbi:GNAT family N-acetyltransferase [Halorarum salinum]|uniref:GNAT family N-acetyltransferase n=1 Tax=Halorarum salinum TaxID=2743089 RepID=UPI001C5283C7|nr:GNAT family N-acetyltransferase [Halobaculum salinum]
MSPNIRPATAADAAPIRDIYAPFVGETSVSFEEEPPDEAAMRRRIADTVDRLPWLVRDDGSVLGYACAHEHRGRGAYRWSVESSVYVREDARRAGVARGLYESLFAVLRRQGFRNVYAVTALPNPASTGFHEAMGFDPVGTFERVGYKHGEWRDVRWWHLSVGEYADDPDPPTTFADARREPWFDDAVATGEGSVDR